MEAKAEVEAVEAALKSTASTSLVVIRTIIVIPMNVIINHHHLPRKANCAPRQLQIHFMFSLIMFNSAIHWFILLLHVQENDNFYERMTYCTSFIVR